MMDYVVIGRQEYLLLTFIWQYQDFFRLLLCFRYFLYSFHLDQINLQSTIFFQASESLQQLFSSFVDLSFSLKAVVIHRLA